jgi:ribosomal subunit interface protein
VNIPTQVTFDGAQSSLALEEHIREQAQRLGRHQVEITSCRVVVASVTGRHRKGSALDVRIHIAMPDGHIEVTRDHDREHAHADVYAAVSDAFDRAVRKLEHDVQVKRDRSRRA